MVGFGISFADDTITGTTETELLDSVPVVALGTFEQDTISTPTIQLIAIGGAADLGNSGGPSVAAGAAIAVDSITSSVLALVNPDSLVKAFTATIDALSSDRKLLLTRRLDSWLPQHGSLD